MTYFQSSVNQSSSAAAAALLQFDDPVGEAMNVLQEHAAITNYHSHASYSSNKEGTTPSGDATTESLVRLMDRAKQLHDSLLGPADDDDDLYDEYDDDPNTGSRVNKQREHDS